MTTEEKLDALLTEQKQTNTLLKQLIKLLELKNTDDWGVIG